MSVYGTSPVGNKSLAGRNPHRRMIEFMETVTQFLEVLPSIIQFQQADTLLDGFLWSDATYKIAKKAAEKIYREIHGEVAPWIGYEKINNQRSKSPKQKD